MRRSMSLLLALLMAAFCFSGCSEKAPDYNALTAPWVSNAYSSFHIECDTTVAGTDTYQDKTTETVQSTADTSKITSFYRSYTQNSTYASFKTEYKSEEYFDGTYFYYNQNGELSYEKYLATELLASTRLATRNLLFSLSEEEIAQLEKQEDDYLLISNSPTAHLDTVDRLLRLYEKADITKTKIKQCEITVRTKDNQLRGYHVVFSCDTVDKKGNDCTISSVIDITLTATAGEVHKPENLSDYLGNDKQVAQGIAEELFDKGQPVDNYPAKKQEIIDRFGSAGEAIVEQEEKKHHYTPSPVSSASSSNPPVAAPSPTVSSQPSSVADPSSKDPSSDKTSSRDYSYTITEITSSQPESEPTDSSSATTQSQPTSSYSGGIDQEFFF